MPDLFCGFWDSANVDVLDFTVDVVCRLHPASSAFLFSQLTDDTQEVLNSSFRRLDVDDKAGATEE